MAPHAAYCAAFGDAASGKVKLHPCARCERPYHNACQPANFARDNICSVCQVLAVEGKTKGSSVSESARSRRSSTSTPSTSHTANTRTDRPSASFMEEFLAKMDKMLDTKLDAKLASTQEVLLGRIDENARAIDEMKTDQNKLSTRLKKIEDGDHVASMVDASQRSRTSSAAVTGRRETHRPVTATQVSSIAARQQSFSSSLVIGGLDAEADGIDIRLAAFAALKTIDPCIVDRDIISARLLGPTPGSGTSTSTAGTSLPTANTGAVSRRSRTDVPRPRSILATLHSGSVVSEAIRAKVRRGRVTTDEINSDLLRNAGYPDSPLSTSNLNINEYLPPVVYRLLRLVRRKAAESGNGFNVFVNTSQIYARWRKSDRPTPISSVEDLEAFLESRKPGNMDNQT